MCRQRNSMARSTNSVSANEQNNEVNEMERGHLLSLTVPHNTVQTSLYANTPKDWHGFRVDEAPASVVDAFWEQLCPCLKNCKRNEQRKENLKNLPDAWDRTIDKLHEVFLREQTREISWHTDIYKTLCNYTKNSSDRGWIQFLYV